MYDIDTLIEICENASTAGYQAVNAAHVVPMIVGQETSLFSGVIDETKPTYYIEDGVCGFAWVNVYPVNKGNTRAGKEERKALEAAGFRKNDYEKSYQLWISDFNQSMQKKEAYARAFAEVLRANGLKAYPGSRMD
jgi:hypothetical protein